ncbi:MAG: tRNA pseudouridine(54/55) synthase Pus10 [Candidatus Aenigmarchaeota archaeon]|nr:tRNA pseudouridine(54/55) synthase Pus10 [Candidatus Aenigmarchaeota archaeon]
MNEEIGRQPSVFYKAVKILSQGYVCNHCLGRQFAQLLSGYDNEERGRIIRNFLAFSIDSGEKMKVDMSNFEEFNFRSKDVKKSGDKKTCVICNNVFDELETYVKEAEKKLKKIGFDTFLVGTKLPDDLIIKEEELWESIGIDWCEPLKSEINRIVGKELEKKLKKSVEFKYPDVVILINLKKKKVEVEVNPLYIYGEYNKLKRGIPQTKWPSGKYKTSVEEIIAKPLMKQIGGKGHKFHGCGREDIDARCLAWRPFVLEILEPKKRKINKKKLIEDVKKTKKVEIRNIEIVNSDMVEKVKSVRPDKTYRVLVKLKDDVSEEDLKKLSILKGKRIYQETPTRVLHRRADLLRKRVVKDIKWKKVGKKKIELTITAEAGTYIKELVSGDKGRTYPSVAEILRTDAEVIELDVIKIHINKKKIEKPLENS